MESQLGGAKNSNTVQISSRKTDCMHVLRTFSELLAIMMLHLICMRVTRDSIVDWVCSKTQTLLATLLATLKISKQTSARISCLFGSRTFVPVSWMCKKQTSVSHSSIESEVLSLDAGLRMDGIPAHDLWDLVVEVLNSSEDVPGIEKSIARRDQYSGIEKSIAQ